MDIFRGNKKAYTILGAGIGYGTDAVLRTILEASTPQCEGIANSTNVKLSNLEEAPHIVLYFVLCLIPTIVKQLKTKQLIAPIVPRVGLEPTQPIGQGILSPSCLPFHHLGDLKKRTAEYAIACKSKAKSVHKQSTLDASIPNDYKIWTLTSSKEWPSHQP